MGTRFDAHATPVEAFKKLYGRRDEELFTKEQLNAPGAFEGEAEFIAFAERDYQTDKHWAFEVRPDECALSYTQKLWTVLKKKAAYLPGC